MVNIYPSEKIPKGLCVVYDTDKTMVYAGLLADIPQFNTGSVVVSYDDFNRIKKTWRRLQ
jgi:hypothetical protein